jgi:hypothetical protein
MSLYRHRYQTDLANGLQDADTICVVVTEAVGIDRLAHWLLCGNWKINCFRNAGFCRFKKNMISWYRSVTKCYIAVRERRTNVEECWWWGKAPWNSWTNWSWIETERRGIQFGEYGECCFQQHFEHEGASCGSDVKWLQALLILSKKFMMHFFCALTATVPVPAERVLAVCAENAKWYLDTWSFVGWFALAVQDRFLVSPSL